jgi:LDH2 family malate/lactate/ureidoglycolate dehydrogenase
LPGERAKKIEARQMKEGVELDEPTWGQLRELADELGEKDLPEPV